MQLPQALRHRLRGARAIAGRRRRRRLRHRPLIAVTTIAACGPTACPMCMLLLIPHLTPLLLLLLPLLLPLTLLLPLLPLLLLPLVSLSMLSLPLLLLPLLLLPLPLLLLLQRGQGLAQRKYLRLQCRQSVH